MMFIWLHNWSLEGRREEVRIDREGERIEREGERRERERIEREGERGLLIVTQSTLGVSQSEGSTVHLLNSGRTSTWCRTEPVWTGL